MHQNAYHLLTLCIWLSLYLRGHQKKFKFPFRTPQTVFRTHSRTYRFIYIDSCTDTVLLYTTCSYELYFCVQNSYKQDAHTHTRTLHFIYYIDSCTDILLLLYTSCTDGLYFFVNCCTTWQYINIHLWCTHYAWISCTAVRLYCSPVSVRLYCQLVLTNESPRKITLMNRVDQSQLRFLGIALPP